MDTNLTWWIIRACFLVSSGVQTEPVWSSVPVDRSWRRSSWVEAGVEVFWLYGQQPPGGGRRGHPAAGPRARQHQHARSLWTGQKQFALKQTCNSQACRAAGSGFRPLRQKMAPMMVCWLLEREMITLGYEGGAV